MKADKLTISLSFFSIIFAGLLYYFSLCDPSTQIIDRPWPFCYEEMNGFYILFCEKKSNIGLYFFIIIILFHLISYINLETDRKKWLRAFLRHVINQDLGGDQYETRITIFRAQSGIKFWPKYIWRCLLKRKNFWKRIQKMPNPFHDYLIPYMRYSYPDARPSTSYFPIAVYNDDQAESLVSLCYKEGRPINCNAPYIQEIKLPDQLDSIKNDGDKSKVEQYMQATSMNDYDRLRLIDRRSNHLYAALIQQDSENDNRVWGVIVFDTNSEKEEDLETKLRNVIDRYLKIIQFSLKFIH